MPLKIREGSGSGVPPREGLGTAGWGKLGEEMLLEPLLLSLPGGQNGIRDLLNQLGAW